MKKILALLMILLMITTVLSGCLNNEDGTKDTADNNETYENEYSWSTMDQGPYNDMVSFATSSDLFNWTDSETVLATHAGVPGAIYKDGVIYVYFVDVSVDGIAERIGMINSSDNGQTWSEKKYIDVDGVGDKVPVDPAPFLLDDGRIRLYYFDIEEGRSSMGSESENKIYSALSSDGLNFVEEGVCFSKEGVYDPDVIEVDGVYRMYVGDLEGKRVISATSSDGLNFVEEGVAYTGSAVPDVFYKDGVYYLYTVGIDISTSSDGASFTKTSYRFESNINLLTADPSVIELNDGTFMMLYKTK
jgi:hypothetical protein